MENLTKEEIYELCIPIESELATTESGMNAHTTCFVYKSCTYEKYRARYEYLRALHKKLMAMVPQEETTETQATPAGKIKIEMSEEQAHITMQAVNVRISNINTRLANRQEKLTLEYEQQLVDNLTECRSLRDSIRLALGLYDE